MLRILGWWVYCSNPCTGTRVLKIDSSLAGLDPYLSSQVPVVTVPKTVPPPPPHTHTVPIAMLLQPNY